jgi:hypothetical protein
MMASRGEDVWVVVYAWNTSTQAYEPDDVANVTLRLLLDGVDTAPANAPFAWNVTGCPGRIVLKLDAAQTAGKRSITVGGKSSTSGVIILDSPVTFEQLPTALVSGRVDSSVGAMAADVLTSSALAASAVGEVQAGLSTLDAAGVRSAVGLASANLDAQLAAIAAFVDTEVAAIKAVTDQLAAAQAEPVAAPPANATPLQKIAWLAVLARNKVNQTAGAAALRNDADSANIATAAVSDDGTTFQRGKWS